MSIFNTDLTIIEDYLLKNGFTKAEQSPYNLYYIQTKQNKIRLRFQYYLDHPKKKNTLIASKLVFNGYRTKWKKIAKVRVDDVFDINIIIKEIYNEHTRYRY